MPAILDMNTSPAEPEQADRKLAMRFQYPSGARPLDGFTIKRGVGRGGFGEVYFAVSDAGKEVALKLIRRNLEVELRGVTHCLNLKHPNLIDVYDIRTDDQDDRWVVMEYVSGASLEDMIERHPQGMPRDMALHWFEGICAGVAYLHDHGVVHRDLKPANIFLDDNRVKIGDYGLSKFISCSRRSGQTESVGTVHYMAPEIANGRYGREIDAYALGIILYEMLTGNVPFVGESVGEVLMKHLTAEPELSQLEEPYRSVVRAAMAKDPERRIDNVAEMAAMLRGVPRSPVNSEIPQYGNALNGAPPVQYGTPQPQHAGGQTPAAGSPWPPNGPASSDLFSPSEGFREFLHRYPEPLWAGIQRGWTGFTQELQTSGEWSPGRRAGIIALIVLVAMTTLPAWIAFGTMAAVSYSAYWVLRAILQMFIRPPATMPAPSWNAGFPPSAAAAFGAPVRHEVSRPVADETPSPAPTTALPPKRETRQARRNRRATWRQAAYDELAAQPPRLRTSNVIASMLAAAGIAPVAALLACLFTIHDFNAELFLWSAIVGTFASWAILIPGQLTEGRVEDQAPMRFVMLLAGALVGVVAWGVAQALFLELPTATDFGFSPKDTLSSEMLDWNSDQLQSAYQRGAVALPLAHFTAFFACLFVALRWWRMAEWTRSTRVSLWWVAWSGAIAFLVSLLWWFPQPLGIVASAVIAFTVQLASPWLSPSRRKQMAHAAVAA